MIGDDQGGALRGHMLEAANLHPEPALVEEPRDRHQVARVERRVETELVDRPLVAKVILGEPQHVPDELPQALRCRGGTGRHTGVAAVPGHGSLIAAAGPGDQPRTGPARRRAPARTSPRPHPGGCRWPRP